MGSFGRSTFVFVIVFGICSAVRSVSADSFRILPADAKRATLGQPQPMPFVKLNGKIYRLAPGAVISDRDNRLILQGALPAGAVVVYTVNPGGEIAHIYILTPGERKAFKSK